MFSLPPLKPQAEVKKISQFIKQTFKSQGFQQGIIALSGGLDSSTALALAVKALGPDRLFTLQLPYQSQSTELSDLIIHHLGIPQSHRLTIPLTDPVNHLAKSLKLDQSKKTRLRFGNLIARTRMICLFDQAKQHQALVIGTENKSENLLGYYTRFGDAASDLEPLAHLFKTQVYQLAQHLRIPDAIINQPPSAGLWSGQTDEKELGFSYQQADPILHLLVDKQLSPSQVIKQGFDSDLVAKLVKRLSAVDFKHHVPYHL